MDEDLTLLGEYGWLTMLALLCALIVSGTVLFLSSGSRLSMERMDVPAIRYAHNTGHADQG